MSTMFRNVPIIIIVHLRSNFIQNLCTPWSTFVYPDEYVSPHLRTTAIIDRTVFLGAHLHYSFQNHVGRVYD